MNTYILHNGRLVEDPRFFETKKGVTLASIRLADNFLGKRDEKYVTMFVEVTLPEGLTKLIQTKGLAKGDVVDVVGELEVREYDRKNVKKGQSAVGTSYEIRFPKQFLLVKVASDGGTSATYTADPEPETEERPAGPKTSAFD